MVADHGNVILALPSVGLHCSKMCQKEKLKEKLDGRAGIELKASGSRETITRQDSRLKDQFVGQGA